MMVCCVKNIRNDGREGITKWLCLFLYLRVPLYIGYLNLQNFNLPLYGDSGLSLENGNYAPYGFDSVQIFL